MTRSHRPCHPSTLVALLALLLVSSIAVGACGSDEPAATTTSTAVTTTTGATTTTEGTTTTAATTTTGATTTTEGTTTTQATTTTATSSTAPSSTTTTLPGEPFDGYARPGVVMGVIGVAFDDVLNVRTGPGVAYPVVARMEPTANRAVATGRGRLIPGAIWYELTVDGVTGWANSRYLAFIGGTSDITSFVVERLGGKTPTAATMLELGELVADTMRSEEPPSRVTVTVAPSVGDLGEVTYDVVGLGDDATVGMRLHVFGQPLGGGAGFSLKSVESTELCGRGVTTEGFCV